MRLPTILILLLASLTGCATTSPTARQSALLGERYAMYGFDGAVVVASRGRVLVDRGFGDVKRDTRFDPGSIMKTFVSAAMLRLEADGRLRTTDPVSKYLGELPADKSAITIAQLLLHTSGLPLDVGEPTVKTTDDLIAAFGRAKLGSAPGAQYAYSNFGYGIALAIVERASGEPFAAYARKHLLARAGMRASRFWTEAALPGEAMATAYSGNSDEELEVAAIPERLGPESPMWGKYVFGAGGLVTTAADLHRWWRALATNRILPPEQTKKALADGYGWNVRGSKIYRGGLIRGAFISMLAGYKDLDADIVYLLNRNTGWHVPLEKNLERILRGEPHVVPPAVIAAAPPVEAVGTFGDIRMTRDGNDLLLAGESQEALSLLWSLTPERREIAARLNANTEGVVLGSAPHPSRSKNWQTFVRRNDEIQRVISDGTKVLATGKGVPASAMRRFRVTGPNTLASYDVATDSVVTMTLRGDEVTISNGGESIVRKKRAGG